jgi:serine/threonine-protein kinase RsbW
VTVVDTLRVVLDAETISASVVRDRFHAWLTALNWPTEQREDLVLAVNEAVSNSIEHAFLADRPADRPGLITVDGRVRPEPDGARCVELTVADNGLWRPAPTDHENRRRGIPLMRALLDSFTISTDERGTRLHMRSHRAPEPGAHWRRSDPGSTARPGR